MAKIPIHKESQANHMTDLNRDYKTSNNTLFEKCLTSDLKKKEVT